MGYLGMRSSFAPTVIALALVIVALLAAFTEYDLPTSGAHVAQYYTWLGDVEMMVFFGFGLLMTFLREYSYSAIGFNFLTSCLVMLEAILVLGAVQQLWGTGGHMIAVNLPLLIEATFCAASAMIAFGAVLGKTTPTELIWLFTMMVPVYALNQRLVFHTLGALDVGGSISIHVFGAYFGLAASLVLSRNGRQSNYGSLNPKNAPSYYTNLFSMVGTLFLWLFWPSFNGALASVSAESHGGEALDAAAIAAQTPQQFLCIVNTLISLLGSCVAAFAASASIGGHFDMVHVQNATLAGGVAMGSAAALNMTPGGALAVGLAAGAISTCSFAYLGPFLERKLRLGDTCGVHSLHGIPGVIGGFVAGFAAMGQKGMAATLLPHGATGLQLGHQVAAVAATVGIAALGGAAAAALVSWLLPSGEVLDGPPLLFNDGAFWCGADLVGRGPEMLNPDAGNGSVLGVTSSRHGYGGSARNGEPVSNGSLYGNGSVKGKNVALPAVDDDRPAADQV